MMRPIVFVDTNVIDNKGSAQHFLGGRFDLEKISKRADIGLPRVVYDELSRHICKYLINQKDSFRRNPHRHILNIEDCVIDKIDPKQLVDDIVKGETIGYEVIDLVDENKAYKEIYEHSIMGTPPFEKSGDKGFKDTIIAKTIDQYVLANPKRKVFLMTRDDKLKEYFEENDRVLLICDYDDFDREYSDDKLTEEGVMERVWDYLAETGLTVLMNKQPDDIWLNHEGNIVTYFIDENLYLLIDSTAREPISSISEDINEALISLEGVNSFANAHIAVAEIDGVFDYYNLESIKQIARILTSNDQIYNIGKDDDIAQFAAKVLEALRENGELELAGDLAKTYQLNPTN
jgi:hypothetical protein